MGVRNNASSPEARAHTAGGQLPPRRCGGGAGRGAAASSEGSPRTHTAGVQLPPRGAGEEPGEEPGRGRGLIRRSRRHCSWWPSVQTPRRFHSTGAPRSDCRGVWNAGGPPTLVPGWGSPLCRGGQSSHIYHRRGEVSSWTVSPGHHCHSC